MTRVYIDMVADLFHAGHVNILRTASALGDQLIVGLHSDEDATSYKRKPVMSLEERAKVVNACRYVDEVIGDAPLVVSQEWIVQHNIDLVVHGDDFGEEEIDRYYRIPRELGILRVLPYTPEISTSDIIRRIRDGHDT